jgi:coenzyme F420-reducing hydrogenase delta subunit
MRLEYPANIKIIHLPCSGKVDVRHLLRAIQKGADGVYVVGCLEGTCHYNDGNYRARERVEYVRTLLEEIGLEADRVRMYNLSSGEGPTFAAYAKEMTELIRSLGPNPLNQRKHNKKKKK